MPQIPPHFSTPAAEIVQRAAEDEAQLKSRGGVASANPPSTDLPDSVRLMSSIPEATVEVTGEVPSFSPVKTPIESRELRTINKDSVRLDEKSINEAIGSKPEAPNVIGTDGTQIITNDRPDDADHP